MSEVDENTRAWCGRVIRMDASQSNFYELDTKPANSYEIDHFIEVQHVVSLLFSKSGPLTVADFHEVQLGYWIDLSTFINRRENMYRISKERNQEKKNIKWTNYAPGESRAQLITRYLGLKTVGYHHDPTQIGQTVEQQVKKLAVSMAWHTGPWSFLTRQVGQQICANMGWREGILNTAQHHEIGDFQPQKWMSEEGKARCRAQG